MYVRDARNRDEAWLLEHIEAMELDELAFRSRDYVIAVNEETNTRAGFGRIRLHKTPDGEYCEITSLGVLTGWRDQGVGAHVVERLVENAQDDGFEEIYSFAPSPEYLEQFGFQKIEESELPTVLQDRLNEKRNTLTAELAPVILDIEAFTMPSLLREAFKNAVESESGDDEDEETPEDFGIDPESATYKYDTGR